MTTQNHNNDARKGVVKDLRKIRDQISHEIKEMTFAEERAYLDTLLNVTALATKKEAKGKRQKAKGTAGPGRLKGARNTKENT